MDWVFTVPPGPRQGAVSAPVLDAAARLVGGHLERHCPDPARVKAASRIAERALRQTAGHAGTGWATLDWEAEQPVLTVRHIAQVVQLATAPLAPEGVWALDEYLGDVSELFQEATSLAVVLPASRSPELDVPKGDVPKGDVVVPPVAPGADRAGTPNTGPVNTGPVNIGPVNIGPVNIAAHVAATMVRQTEAGASTLEAATAAGAGASQAALENYVRTNGGDVPTRPGDVAQAFADLMNASGADFFVSSSDDNRAVLVNRACPFGTAVLGQHTLCRTSTSLLGALGARVAGAADVALSESLAAGDARCHLALNFATNDSRWSQHYSWPLANRPLGGGGELGFRVALTLQLPRDKRSVGILRHLLADVLEEVGVLDEDRRDVELAVTEAAANVIEHSGSGDAYEVTVTIGPVLAELRVVDVGRGFDHVLLSEAKAGPEDEQGRGLALMNALVDQVRFLSAPERGTVVHLIKRLHFDDDSPARRLMLTRSTGSPNSGNRPEMQES
ncbi:MAG TPA: ATP-binding protein [Acidimicrobiales bacterium]|nr:ATP-binding protein [Acidimicrobiales bacterium]